MSGPDTFNAIGSQSSLCRFGVRHTRGAVAQFTSVHFIVKLRFFAPIKTLDIGHLRYKKTHANKLQSLLNHVINFFVY